MKDSVSYETGEQENHELIVLILLKLEYERIIVMYIRLVVKKWISQYGAAV